MILYQFSHDEITKYYCSVFLNYVYCFTFIQAMHY